MKPIIVLVTEGGLIQQVMASGDAQVFEVSYDRDEIADKEIEDPTRISKIDNDQCIIHEWTTLFDLEDTAFITAVADEMAKQKAAHDYLK
jgi:hypothetical protein